jgi:integrative and conjugative element protein (TIGR02256 family)
MLFERPFLGPNAFVLIEDSVWSIVQPYAQISKNASEAGGILLGYRRGKHLHIASATKPQNDDVRERFRFLRQDKQHEVLARKAWNESGGTLDYIGEWHTHPESSPVPSPIDQREWKKILTRQQAGMAFMIIGTHRCWFGVGEKNTVREAKVLNLSEN